MRIVHVIARLNDGGPARVVASLARMMRDHGHQTTVLTGTPAADEPDLAPRLAADGLLIERVPGLARGVDPRADAGALIALGRRLRALRPDVVHTHTAKAGVLGRLLCQLDRRPCLHTYHGHVLGGYYGPVVTAGMVAVERLLGTHGHLHALTRSQARELRRDHGIGDRRRWHVLPPPVAAVAPQPAPWHARLRPDVPRIGFLGRFAPVKDAGLWLDALAALARRRPVQGVLCGDGVERGLSEARATLNDLPTLFTGYVPAGEALAAYDLLLLTSRDEGLPLAAIEALSAGVAVVAPSVGGLADLIAAGAVEPAAREAAALADACERLLDNPELRAHRLAAGGAIARALAPAVLARRYDALYRAVNRS